MREEVVRIAIADVLNEGDEGHNEWNFETAGQDYYDIFVEAVMERIKQLDR